MPGMEQFRHIGEVLGSMKALMVLQDDIQFNQCQCCLLFDIFCLAFDTIAEEIRHNLKFEEKNKKWKALEHPLGELYRVFKEGELYIKYCLDIKDWWGKAISIHQNKDCVEYHIHNLFCLFPAVIEAIENAGEIAGLNEDDMKKRKVVLTRKYNKEWNDPKLFHWRFGKQYLISREICNRLQSAWRQDKWRLIETLEDKRILLSDALTKNEHRLADLLIKKLHGSEQFKGKLFPSSILLGAKDYQVRRRLEGGGQYKEIHWLGESFVLRHFYGEVESLNSEISTLLSLSHPNILQNLCGFYDDEKKECLLVMELMNKDLISFMKENCSARRRILLAFPVAVEIMLQIARGMEYLHSQKIYHGDLNPANILVKVRNSTEGYLQVKISGYGLSSVKNTTRNSTNQNTDQVTTDTCIWYAPEVLAEQEQPGSAFTCKYSEKADVYSFGMLCFELLTGKVPFEDGHLQGEKMSRNIRTGERPLFPFPSPKFLVNLTKKCWQNDPIQRPSFSSICRILRSIKKFLAMNPDNEEGGDPAPVSRIPFQMFAYKLAEKDKTSMSIKDDRSQDPTNDATSTGRDDGVSVADDQLVPASDTASFSFDLISVSSETPVRKISQRNKSAELKMRKGPGTTKAQTPRQSPAQSPLRTFSHNLKSTKGSMSPLAMSPIHPRIRGRPVPNS
ncbi:hypothetical protein CMV_026737 [Castanea mollissima]|uniref:Protein kinase domain-containing protein n=1 Tax=Castanea mollissima TaxID=60419 RepID=A0A8J4QL60_9ROSI|nr:hypothetical protein CMV_026737 [Castanea mollissima]